MRKGVMALLLMVLAVFSHAQNLDEWARQKRTQIRYLVNQVAALQVYIDLGQQGYAIYRDGLELIGDSKDGEFNLHKDYFASLSNVNPRIGHSAKVDEINVWNEQVQLFERRIRKLDVGDASASIRRLFVALAQKSADHVAQLQLLVTDGNYQLTNEERIEQIGKVHRDMLRLYGFAKQTFQDAILQSKALPRQDREIDIIKQLQGLP